MNTQPAGTMLAALAAAASSSCGGRAPRRREPPDGHWRFADEPLLRVHRHARTRPWRPRRGRLGVELIVNDAQRGAATQVQQVESFIAQKVDAIILNPCEVEASSPAVDKAVAGGIPVVNVNSETRSAPTAFVGSRDEESARIAMDYIAKRLHGKGNVVMMHGFMGQAAQIKRDRGAREVLAKNPGLHLLADQTAEWDRAKAMTLMENWIQSYGPQINAVFAQNDEMAMGALIALEQAKKKDKVDRRQRGCHRRRPPGGEARPPRRHGLPGCRGPGRQSRRNSRPNRPQAALRQTDLHPVPVGHQRKHRPVPEVVGTAWWGRLQPACNKPLLSPSQQLRHARHEHRVDAVRARA